MRLLDVKTKTLHTFYGDNVPPYAILSHTWGKEEEEITNAQIKDLKSCCNIIGFRKIDLLCEQAIKDGLEYGWCDTCCIDKSSSSELSEAINSMYKWYKNSKICYVYLIDVDHTKGEDFVSSRWWTRSWTLQELLAPDSVQFFDRNWSCMGDKHKLASSISIKTGIDKQSLLRPGAIPSMSIAQRMSWASHRQATRVEDIAYSLLGIFGINMSLQYGEGEMAFIRLQEIILERNNDQSFFAWGISERPLEDLVEYRPTGFMIGSNTTEHGLFAGSPKLFEKCQKIQFHHFFAATAPMSMANGALHLEMPLLTLVSLTKAMWSDNSDTYRVAILPCSHIDFPHRMLGILLDSWSANRNSRFRRLVLRGAISTFLVDNIGLPEVGEVHISDRSRIEMAKMDRNRGASQVTIMLRAKDLQSKGYVPVGVLPTPWNWDPKTLTLSHKCVQAPEITTMEFFSDANNTHVYISLELDQIYDGHISTPSLCRAGIRRSGATKQSLLEHAHDDDIKQTSGRVYSRPYYLHKRIFHHFIFEIDLDELSKH